MSETVEKVDQIENEVIQSGFLKQSLDRTNRQIRTERGDAIAEDLEIAYKRNVENLEVEIRRAERKQLNAFDFSPTNAQSLVMGKDVDALDILEEDMKIGLEIRNLKIKLNIAKARYNFLFEKMYDLEDVY